VIEVTRSNAGLVACEGMRLLGRQKFGRKILKWFLNK
jgi:hypothetical protein